MFLEGAGVILKTGLEGLNLIGDGVDLFLAILEAFQSVEDWLAYFV